jgi:hypothetical protein
MNPFVETAVDALHMACELLIRAAIAAVHPIRFLCSPGYRSSQLKSKGENPRSFWGKMVGGVVGLLFVSAIIVGLSCLFLSATRSAGTPPEGARTEKIKRAWTALERVIKKQPEGE